MVYSTIMNVTIFMNGRGTSVSKDEGNLVCELNELSQLVLKLKIHYTVTAPT